MNSENNTDNNGVKNNLLIIDDEENMRHMLTSMLKKSGYLIETASDGHEALQVLEKKQYDFILCDLKMPRMSGMDFLKTAKDMLKETTVIMMSAYGTIDTAIEAMKMGAYDFISKPFKTDEVYLALKKAEERERLKKENLLLRQKIRRFEENYNLGNMVGKSEVMQSVFKLSANVAQYSTTVLIIGESGTGKELIARGIHFNSKRSEMSFVPVNCGGIPETLIESEFFGYKKGAFSGADKNKKGLFEEADSGTIFLDEVGELPLFLQVKLLRVLQENEIRPIGDSKTRKIDVRVVAATSKNLDEEVKAGNFRQDLFYRLNVLQIKLPPLRERAEDISLLSQHFINMFKKSLDKDIKGISPEAMSVLLEYKWPGNVRELKNAIERSVVLSEGDILTVENFPAQLHAGVEIETEDTNIPFEGYSLKDAQKVWEKKLIIKALNATGGNRSKATQLLGISHPSLLSKIKAYSIE
ncbi:MAG: sigma-54-dependent Fis family transcriptional regulator [Desulfobacteraceae bacterium]|nr:sigma-54-dependent Fis family transcriptional regulator [Desulfobacteraceae bacterium]